MDSGISTSSYTLKMKHVKESLVFPCPLKIENTLWERTILIENCESLNMSKYI